ncbi:hypothetical protein [Cryptosporangium sp. NPDC051539]|uniref:hypothetical protein n=1 Tax=Cryptosporangium sp. NPDC051539 TaxID=3363962 RepID=UPI0037A9C06C
MASEHADAVLEIYRLGMATGLATFETSVPSSETFSAARLPSHRFVGSAGATVPGATRS